MMDRSGGERTHCGGYHEDEDTGRSKGKKDCRNGIWMHWGMRDDRLGADVTRSRGTGRQRLDWTVGQVDVAVDPDWSDSCSSQRAND